MITSTVFGGAQRSQSFEGTVEDQEDLIEEFHDYLTENG